jgi:hypothetical protein
MLQLFFIDFVLGSLFTIFILKVIFHLERAIIHLKLIGHFISKGIVHFKRKKAFVTVIFYLQLCLFAFYLFIIPFTVASMPF